MNIILKQTKEEELIYLTELEEISFAINGKYFENGILPPFSEEERKAYSLKALYEEKNVVILSIYLENEIVGCTVVKDVDFDKKEIVLFFISPKCQGKSLGQKALKMVEDTFPETRIWGLVTPTQVLRNVVFYVNKCGYSIVQVDEYDKKKECGMFVFEKRKEVS